MSPKRGLIGLFALIFFLSSIGLALLALDDQKDLSSRASIGLISNLEPALPGEINLSSDSTWDGHPFRLPVKIKYANTSWFPPQETPAVFLNQKRPISVSLFLDSMSLKKLQQILGPDFTSPRSLGSTPVSTSGWSVNSYSFKFLGLEKIVDLWSSPQGISLVAVMPDQSGRNEVEDLVNGLSFEGFGNQVKGLTSPDDSARLAALVRPSVVMIVNNYCAVVKFADQEYPFCLAQSGSGFFVNQDGYLATNGHVVKNLPESSLFYAVVSGSLDNLLGDFLQSYYSLQMGSLVDRSFVEGKVKEAHTSKETIYQVAALVQQMYQKGFFKIVDSQNHYFVQLGNTPIQLSQTGVNIGTDIVVASLVASDYADPDPNLGFTTSDVALLKVSGSNFPALPLGNLDDINVGSNLLVVGYPGVAMGSNSLLLDTSANTEPTFTKGVVSAFKQAKGNKNNLIQTDASINHGNSGGPAVSSDGHVIGIATYGLTPEEGGGNYNFLRDIGDLKKLMQANNVSAEESQTFKLWQTGLDNYWLAYFKYAETNFEKVSGAYPQHPTVARYLKDAHLKTGTPEDHTPQFTRGQRHLYMNLSGATMIISLTLIIILGISNYIDNKRHSTPISLPAKVL